MGALKRVALFPLYIVQLPLLALMFAYCRLVDQHDERSQFTGGYFVTAVRNPDPS